MKALGCGGILSILSILGSMALLMIILSQQQLLTNLNRGTEKLPMELKRLGNQQPQLDASKVLMEKLLTHGKKVVEDLEAEVAKLLSDMEKTKTEIDVCQAEKKAEADELANKEMELTETEATLKAESDAWNQEITNLKAQVTGYRPICDYVKTDETAKKLCGTKGEPLA